MTVAESLRKIRKEHKLTQQDIANVLGVDRTTYTLYETGNTNPPIESLEKLSSIYNATIGYILGKEEDNHRERIGTGANMVREGSVDPLAYLPKDEQTLLIAYRVLSDEDKDKLRNSVIEALKKNDAKKQVL